MWWEKHTSFTLPTPPTFVVAVEDTSGSADKWPLQLCSIEAWGKGLREGIGRKVVEGSKKVIQLWIIFWQSEKSMTSPLSASSKRPDARVHSQKFDVSSISLNLARCSLIGSIWLDVNFTGAHLLSHPANFLDCSYILSIHVHRLRGKKKILIQCLARF